MVRRYSPLVMAITRSYQLDTVDAQDVSQTVWLRLVEHLGYLRTPDALPGWLFVNYVTLPADSLEAGRNDAALDALEVNPLAQVPVKELSKRYTIHVRATEAGAGRLAQLLDAAGQVQGLGEALGVGRGGVGVLEVHALGGVAQDRGMELGLPIGQCH